MRQVANYITAGQHGNINTINEAMDQSSRQSAEAGKERPSQKDENSPGRSSPGEGQVVFTWGAEVLVGHPLST